MTTRLVRFIQEDDGQDLIEYALLGGVIVAVTAAVIGNIGKATAALMTALCGQIPGC